MKYLRWFKMVVALLGLSITPASAQWEGSGIGISGGSGGGGGGNATSVVFVGAATGAANTYTIAATVPLNYTLSNLNIIRTTFSATSTGASTLNVNSTGALPIVVNIGSGLVAAGAGDLITGSVYDLTYSTNSATACGSSCYVATVIPLSSVVAGTS